MNFQTTDALTFDIRCDLVVVGCNPENADCTNPRGDLFGEAVYVQATDSLGNRKETFIGTDADGQGRKLAQAKRLLVGLQARALSGKLPVGFHRWNDARPVYGSEAYEAYGQADDLAWERSLED